VPSAVDAARDTELAKDAAAVVNAFYNTRPRFTPSGTRVVFVSDRDGIPQLYLADAAHPETPAVHFLTTKERIEETPAITPDGKSVIFMSNQRAPDNLSIFRVGLDGSGLVELTSAEIAKRDMPFLPDGSAGTMIYSSRSPTEKGIRVLTQSTLDGTPPKVAFTDKSPGGLSDVSRDGKLALVLRYVSPRDVRVLRVDLTNGAPQVIYPAEARAESVLHASFSADGTRIFVATQAGDTAALVALDAKTFAEKARYVETKPATARIEDMAVAKKGDRIALRIDAGNHSEVRLLDAKTLKPTVPVFLPLGSGEGLTFTDDGKTLGLEWSKADAPNDLLAVDTESGKTRPLRTESRPAIAKLPEVLAWASSVPSFDGTMVPVNVYLPTPLAEGKKLSVVVMVHSGPAQASQAGWSSWTRFFTAHDFAVVDPNVRGSTGFGSAYEKADDGPKRLDAVKDVDAVGAWVITQPWAAPDRLALLGASYGGYLTLMGLSRSPSLWKAGVDVVGVVHWQTFVSTAPSLGRESLATELGADAISPVLDKITSPLFVYAGQNDSRVPRADSDAIVASLRARKIPTYYMIGANEEHSLDRNETKKLFLARALRFLETNLNK
jgi:dipeptidyl aminopeptidase/acylaminoacyl peptidase